MAKRGDKTIISDTLVGMTLTGQERRSACLVQFTGQDIGRPYFLKEDKGVIGRDPRATLWIDELKVSREHCAFQVDRSGVWVRDLKSANGTYVNGHKITGDTHLRDGDMLTLGSASFKYFAPGNVEQLFFDKVYKEKTIDEKTKVFNDKYLMATLRSEIRASQVIGRELCLIMYDLDHFKQCNDTFGHRFGDHVLQVTAKIVSGVVRKNDDLCRYGGEEFAIIARQTPISTAAKLAERIRRAVEQQVFDVKRGGRLHQHVQTLSLGVVQLSPTYNTVDKMFKAADKKLYQSKKAGRNRVTA